MKVLITGTFCSGKSTLVSDLEYQLPDWTGLHDHCRSLLAQFPSIDWYIPEVRSYLLVHQVFTESLAKGNVLVDGGVISNIAHDRALLHHPDFREAALNRLRFSRYDAVFVCNHAEIGLVDDGERFLDHELRERVALAVIETLEAMSYRYRVVDGSRTDRVLKVLSELTQGTDT